MNVQASDVVHSKPQATFCLLVVEQMDSYEHGLMSSVHWPDQVEHGSNGWVMHWTFQFLR